ncbi:UNVERIFIED_CONTAM: Tn7-like transposition protein D [Lysinibacillus xylanilyticus]
MKSITRKHRKAFHPVRHILFIHFLSASIDNFKDFLNIKYHPFGEAPFYCLNPAAVHYKERVLFDLQISICKDTKRPVGTFSCSCGFIFSRRGPDECPEDIFKIGRIKEFGYIWRDKLKQLVHHEKKSWNAAAKELNCDINTVKKYSSKRIFEENQCNQEKVEIVHKRVEWLALMKQYPEYSVTALRRMAPALYMWHYRNNLEWLKSTSPKQMVKNTTSKRVDWSKRDIQMLTDIKKAIIKLKANDRPIFINKSRIGKEIGCLSFIEKHLDKMPRTKEYLEYHVESREEFQIRRIIWACRELNENSQDVKKWKVKRLAGIRENVNKFVLIFMEKEISKYKEGVQNAENKTLAIFERNSEPSMAWECYIEEQSMVHTDWFYM